MTARRGIVTTVAAAICVAIGVSATGAAAGSASGHIGYFKNAKSSIYCDYLYGGTTAAYRFVSCGMKGKLMPEEPKPKGGCPLDTDYVGDRMILMQTGKGQTQPCAGDAGPFGNPKAAVAIANGKSWHGGPFSCKSAAASMTCKNTSGHGFVLARRLWFVH